MKYSKVARIVSNLRYAADFLEEHGVELPDDSIGEVSFDASFYLTEREHMQRATKTLAKAGIVRKDANDWSFEVTKHFGDHVKMTFWSPRSTVCTRRVVEVKQVPKREYVEVPGQFTEEEVVEWDCDPIIAEHTSQN